MTKQLLLVAAGLCTAAAAVAPHAAIRIAAACTKTLKTGPAVGLNVDADGAYSILVDEAVWLQSSGSEKACVAGQAVGLQLARPPEAASGTDAFGLWNGTTVTWTVPGSASSIVYTYKVYGDAVPGLAVLTASFPNGLNTSGCGDASSAGWASTAFPAFNTSAGKASSLAFVSWSGEALANTIAVQGLAAIAAGPCLDCGPIIGVDPSSGTTLSISPLDNVKVLPQGGLTGTTNATFAMGISAAIPSLPAGFSYSVVLQASAGGHTAATYALGAALRSYYGTWRIPSVTLEKLSYYTDDGAYYYVWTHWLTQNRPWPAETGLLEVVRNLTARGVPVSALQLDDWWYQGSFYFGNVRSITNYTADPDPRLFPHGLAAFAAQLGLPLQLYAPFWADNYPTPYNMTPSTSFKGTKLVTPGDSYPFFSDFLDGAAAQVAGGPAKPQPTGAGLAAFEIDFLRSNFAGSASMFETVDSAAQWYAGLGDAAVERGIALQLCLPSATDALVSLAHPAMVQARASADYVNTRTNAAYLGGSSLLLGAMDVAPSKDTLWTASPQPPTASDTKHDGYTTQPHVVLDVTLAVLSMGPVGISDGIGQTDVGLISQAYRSPTDGTLLRPSRPLSWVDSVLLNASRPGAGGGPAVGTAPDLQDVRGTHSEVPAAPGGSPSGPVLITHTLLAWNTSLPVALGPTDLYPPPAPGTRLALRQHIFAPAGPAQAAGCVAGQPAAPSCVTLLPAGALPVVPASGSNAEGDLLGLWHASEALSNGAFFLGDLTSVVHVAPQRFQYVHVPAPGEGVQAQPGPAGIVAGVVGTAGQSVTVYAVDPKGIVRSTTAVLPASGFVEVGL